MNKLHKLIVALFVGLFIAMTPVIAQEATAENGQHRQCQRNISVPIQANQFCYLPNSNSFVLIDSAENAIELLRTEKDTMVIVHPSKNRNRPTFRLLWSSQCRCCCRCRYRLSLRRRLP